MKGQYPELASPLSGGLYVVATPIGNLEDLGFRALRVLEKSGWVAAEDTRETRKLLDHYGIGGKPLHSFHEHSTASRVEELVLSLKTGGTGAYVSDAGTPGLCDPGAALVRACVAAGVTVYPIPGSSAPLALLSVGGFDESAFTFQGFFPREKKERQEWADTAGGLQIFFESPHRIQGALAFLGETFPAAQLVVGRELTKRFETISRGPCGELAESLTKEEPRGEYVLALSLPVHVFSEGLPEEEVRALVKELAVLGASQKVLLRVGMSHGLRKNEAYKLSLEVLEN
jgi:16S rRNA (cytidine1402-2'-O)-methyltransferase